MKRASFLIAAFVAALQPARAETLPRRAHMTCEMVRSFVAQVGLAQAKAAALSAGMTTAEEERAKHCLITNANSAFAKNGSSNYNEGRNSPKKLSSTASR